MTEAASSSVAATPASTKLLSEPSIRHLPLGTMRFAGTPRSGSPELLRQLRNKLIESAKIEGESRAEEIRARSRGNLVETILSLLVGGEIRKGKREFLPLDRMSAKISAAIASEKPIQFSLPALSFKVDNWLKSDSPFADFAEAFTLVKIFSLLHSIRVLYPHGAVFNVLLDGHRFRHCFGISEGQVAEYQESLSAILSWLDFREEIRLHDYGTFLNQKLDLTSQLLRVAQHGEHWRSFGASALSGFSAENLQKTINRLNQLPFGSPDRNQDGENQLISLFRSSLFSVRIKDLFPRKEMENEVREVFSNITDIQDPRYGKARRLIIERGWYAATNYLCSVRMDQILGDPATLLIPDSIRCTIHPKPGQLGFMTLNNRTRIESWHGVGYMLHADNALKIGATFRISAESYDLEKVVFPLPHATKFGLQLYCSPSIACSEQDLPKVQIN